MNARSVEPVRVGVIGVGHLGYLHAKMLAGLPSARLAGVHDIFGLGPEEPIFNIAAGACQPYPDFARTFLSDPACIQFARDVSSACRWTSVRDPLASQILYALGLEHEVLPCTAFHAPRRLKPLNGYGEALGVNLMPLAGHYKLKEDIDEKAWAVTIEAFLSDMRKRHSLFFIAHDLSEKEFMKHFLASGEVIFYSPRWRDYLPVYGKCSAVIASRIHGAVCAAGFGKPAVIVGNDTRLLIGDYINIPAIYVSKVKVEELVVSLRQPYPWVAGKETGSLPSGTKPSRVAERRDRCSGHAEGRGA